MSGEERGRGGVKRIGDEGREFCSEEGIAAGAGKGWRERSTKTRVTNRRPDPHCEDGKIMFLLLKAEGPPCGGRRNHLVDLMIK